MAGGKGVDIPGAGIEVDIEGIRGVDIGPDKVVADKPEGAASTAGRLNGW